VEYEIADDPQGLSESEEADRDGGIRAPVSFRKGAPPARKSSPARQEPIEQMGEPA
jgi:hypothetical protein